MRLLFYLPFIFLLSRGAKNNMHILHILHKSLWIKGFRVFTNLHICAGCAGFYILWLDFCFRTDFPTPFLWIWYNNFQLKQSPAKI